MSELTRETLLALCERAAAFPKSSWDDRDCAQATLQLGACWALLKAGCAFRVADIDDRLQSIWVEITFTDFHGSEYGQVDNHTETFYIPTEDRLQKREAGSGHWY